MMVENKDYELVPADTENEQAWDVRITSTEFNETVIRFGNVVANGKDSVLNFNFIVVYAPSDYITPENPELQNVVGQILASVIENAIIENTLVLDEEK